MPFTLFRTLISVLHSQLALAMEIFFSERRLRRVVRGYLEDYHGSRTYFGLEKGYPVPRGSGRPSVGGGFSTSRRLAGCIAGTSVGRHQRASFPSPDFFGNQAVIGLGDTTHPPAFQSTSNAGLSAEVRSMS